MTTAHSYAKALQSLVRDNEEKGKEYLANLHAALKRRGHEKLLPNIFTEYEKLVLAEERAQSFRAVTPERERTRVLFELYKKLVTHQ